MTALDFRAAFAELFGFTEQHPTFVDAHRASTSPQAFRRGMQDFWRYKATVGNAFVDPHRFATFQHDDLFHFCTSRDFGPDEQALAAVAERAPELLAELLAIGDSPVGYREGALPAGVPTLFHTRHCAQLAFLLHHLRRLGDPTRMHFLEVGGGFGNVVRLLGTHSGFGSWTIFDLPFVGELQRWFLARTLPQHRQEHDDFGALAGGAIRCVDTEHRNEFVDEFPGADVLVSTHAWSELSDDEFVWYLRNLLPKVQHVLYAASAEFPSQQVTRRRLERLQQELRIVDAYWSQHGSVVTALLTRR